MGFRILMDESVGDAVKRIACEQIDSALGEIEDRSLDRHVVVHQVRKRCKKMRGLVRLVRPQFQETYQLENAWYRDSARSLSGLRDARSIMDTFDRLMAHYGGAIDHKVFSSIQAQLADRHKRVLDDEVGLWKGLEEFLQRMHEGRERIVAWELPNDGFDAVETGLARNYARGRAAMAEAGLNPSTETFHEWRKRAKYLWHHIRLLQNIWNTPMKAWRNEADLLSEHLGDDHDLSTLRGTLLDSPEAFGSEDTIQATIGMINQRQVELRTKSLALGARILAERPGRFAGRLRCYWEAWRGEAQVEPQVMHQPRLVTF